MPTSITIAAGFVGVLALGAGADQIATAPLPENPDILVGVLQSTVPVAWNDAKDALESVDAELFAPQSTAEREIVIELASALAPWECTGPWIGAQRLAALGALDVGWADVHGFPVVDIPWSADQPHGSSSLFWSAAIDARDETLDTWVNVLPDPDAGAPVYGYVFIIEGPLPDCDLDGIPDQFEIGILGEADADGNGVPDVCALPADLNGDGRVNGPDLAIMLGSWGKCPPEQPCPADLDDSGRIDGVDLGILLGSWTG